MTVQYVFLSLHRCSHASFHTKLTACVSRPTLSTAHRQHKKEVMAIEIINFQ
jgi:hypothetical protein